MMVLRRVCCLVAVVLIVFGIQGCSESISSNEELSPESQTSRVRFVLVDAPGDYLEVNVEIVDIQYNSSDNDEGWKSFTPQSGYPIGVDLTELIAGNSLLLSDEIIPSGMLKQIRLVLSDKNTLVIEDENGVPSGPIDLKTPSAQQSGLKLKLDAELEPGFSYTFILDWDVNKSIVKAGNSGKYNLKPVINVIAEVNSGTLEGNVIGKLSAEDAEAVVLENVMVEVFSIKDNVETYVSSTKTNSNGDFMFQGLADGAYVLKIMHLGYQDYESEMNPGILIEVGKVNVFDSIELLLADSLKGNVVGKLLEVDANAVALEGVTVQLFDSNDVAITTTTTDVNGDFSFQGLVTGSYVLKITHAGYQNYISAPIEVEYGVLKDITGNIELLLVV